jgi:hypothetical protein
MIIKRVTEVVDQTKNEYQEKQLTTKIQTLKPLIILGDEGCGSENLYSIFHKVKKRKYRLDNLRNCAAFVCHEQAERSRIQFCLIYATKLLSFNNQNKVVYIFFLEIKSSNDDVFCHMFNSSTSNRTMRSFYARFLTLYSKKLG